MKCSKTISSGLKEIFTRSEKGLKIREDLERNLGGVCSAFVDLLSWTAFNSEIMAPGICDGSLFTDRSLSEIDFCARKRLEGNTDLASTLGNLGGGGCFEPAARELAKLWALDESSCSAECGSGYPRILCNAYYSIATLFSREFQSITDEANPENGKDIRNIETFWPVHDEPY